MRDLLQAITPDRLSTFALVCLGILVPAILWQLAEMAWHAYRMRRSLHRGRKVIAFRRQPQMHVSWPVFVLLNCAVRIAIWRERYRIWRGVLAVRFADWRERRQIRKHGDTQVGDTLIRRASGKWR